MVLPPDLRRVGDELTSAAARSLDARRHRRALIGRAAATAAAGVLAIAVLSPAALGPAQMPPRPSLAQVGGAPTFVDDGVASSCDQARGSRFGLPACGRTASLEPARQPTILPRRPAAARI
jgi:hypothetical protein